MLKDIGPAVQWRDFDDGNEWQHHVDCLEGIPQGLRQVSFDNGGRLLASFHSEALLQTLQEPGHFTPHPPSAPGPNTHKTDQRRSNTCVISRSCACPHSQKKFHPHLKVSGQHQPSTVA